MPAMPGPIDAAMDGDSDYLSVVADGNNAVLSYSIGYHGQLAQIDTDDDNRPNSMSGLAERL